MGQRADGVVIGQLVLLTHNQRFNVKATAGMGVSVVRATPYIDKIDKFEKIIFKATEKGIDHIP